MPKTARTETLDLRITGDQKELIRRAAAIQGQTMTEFVLSAVEPVAVALVERRETIELSQSAWRAFVELTETETPAPALARREAQAFLAESRVEAPVAP